MRFKLITPLVIAGSLAACFERTTAPVQAENTASVPTQNASSIPQATILSQTVLSDPSNSFSDGGVITEFQPVSNRNLTCISVRGVNAASGVALQCFPNSPSAPETPRP